MAKNQPPVDTSLLLAGRNPVREALERGDARLERVFLQQNAHLPDLHRAARSAAVPVQFVPSQRLDRLAPGLTHQGVVAILSVRPYLDVDEMLAEIAPSYEDVIARSPLLLALDGMEDPHNLGAILRSAVAAGVSGVILPQQGTAPLGAVALKASAGSALRIPVARVPKLTLTIDALKERGYWIVGAAGDGETSYDLVPWKRPTVLIIGGEGEGLSRGVRAACDVVASIPLPGDVESLNASVAAGIFLFEAVRQRDLADGGAEG